MKNKLSSTVERLLPDVTFLIAVGRGLSALGIAVLLFVIPDKSRVILGNTMGFFWLFSGIALLRRRKDDPIVAMIGTGYARVIALVGALTGLLVVTRGLSRTVVPEGSLIMLLGIVIFLTGILHALAFIRVGATRNWHHILNLLLGIFEVFFGVTLVLSPLDRSPASYWIATIWALIFGCLVIGEAIVERTTGKKPEDQLATELGTTSTECSHQ